MKRDRTIWVAIAFCIGISMCTYAVAVWVGYKWGVSSVEDEHASSSVSVVEEEGSVSNPPEGWHLLKDPLPVVKNRVR